MFSTGSAVSIPSFFVILFERHVSNTPVCLKRFSKYVWNLVPRRTYLINEFHANFIVGMKHIKLLK